MSTSETPSFPVNLADEDWQQKLPPLAYQVLRAAGTEPPFSSALLKENRKGQFVCQGCGAPLFASEAKFDSGTGWPSFYQPLDPQGLVTKEDDRLTRVRTEVLCANCGGHLGHVFEDGPRPTGLRYCMNGAALKFQP